MRRSVLLTVAALGGLVSLIGGVGLFSALTDTARTGTNSAESAALGASADIQLATASVVAGGVGPITCDPVFSENLASGFFSLSNLGPGNQSSKVFFCLRNVGSQPVSLTAFVDELVDLELACTGDEALNGDTTCAAGQQGELANALAAIYGKYATCDQGNGSSGGLGLAANVSAYESLGSLAPGQTGCFSALIDYALGQSTTVVQQAQSDRVTWRYKFHAQA